MKNLSSSAEVWSQQGTMRRERKDSRTARKFEIYSAMRILRGQLTEPRPEELLWLAVIGRAVKDAYSIPEKNEKVREHARWWIDSAYFAGVAEAIGLNPQWTREKIRQIAKSAIR
jgi:hypothetical protein